MSDGTRRRRHRVVAIASETCYTAHACLGMKGEEEEGGVLDPGPELNVSLSTTEEASNENKLPFLSWDVRYSTVKDSFFFWF